MISRCFTG
uniref:Uncharacterized protein n=1 Tax=Anguilla anguilla TaxID=7936 RepID=A0A0E9UEU8_ANGAN